MLLFISQIQKDVHILHKSAFKNQVILINILFTTQSIHNQLKLFLE